MQFFRNGKFYKLAGGTLEINGVRMHQTKNKTPLEDARDKAGLLGVCRGSSVLDVCAGLGYTAIEAAKRGATVVTIEKDENVLEIAKANKDSARLFGSKNIKIILGDAFEEIKKFGSESFDFIIHDPPRLSLAGELYSLDFYKELYRVLKKGGRLFHYTGEPGKARGKRIPKGVKERLLEAGFKKIFWREDCLGFLAEK